MLDQLAKLEKLVEQAYGAQHPNRDPWADWLYPNHVRWVAQKTDELTSKHGGRREIAVAAALVHDIADVFMPRHVEDHEDQSMRIGRDLCQQAGYSDEDIAVIIDDISLKHSCHDGVIPESLEGRVMATADALAHFETDFYKHAFANDAVGGKPEDMKAWALKKLDRDLNVKILLEDERTDDVLQKYKALQSLANSLTHKPQ